MWNYKISQRSKDREIIRFGKDEAHIKIILEKDKVSHRIDLHLKKNKSKGVAIDGIPIKKQSELFGMLNLVFFSPEDLNIIKDGPAERRRFMDIEISQIDRIYLYNLTNYNKILMQRNNLLKQIEYKRNLLDTLPVWDKKLVEYGTKVIEARFKFIKKLNMLVEDIHSEITGGRENLQVEYEPNVRQDEFEKRLNKSLERDLKVRSTSIGPQRDDLKF